VAEKIVELVETFKKFVILSEAKDLLFARSKQVLRFAQDDKQVKISSRRQRTS
jgi:hypothetical protein